MACARQPHFASAIRSRDLTPFEVNGFSPVLSKELHEVSKAAHEQYPCQHVETQSSLFFLSPKTPTLGL